MALRAATRDVTRYRPIEGDELNSRELAEFREIIAAVDFNWSVASDRRWLKANILRSQWKSRQAWEDYDRIGEVHKAINRASRVGGYAKLRVVQINPDGTDGPTVEDGLAQEIVQQIYAPYGGVRGLVDRFFALMKVPGDSYLIRVRAEDGEVDGYHFLSSHEVDKANLETFADQESDDKELTWITLPSGSINGQPMTRTIEGRDMLGRVWLPGRRYVDEADSPLSALATECEVLWGLTEAMKANIRNRFLLGGIMGFPSGIQSVKVPGAARGSRTVLDYIEQSMTRAVTKLDDAKARLPILMQAKAEDLQGIVNINFNQEIFATDLQLRAELIERILFGLDIHTQATKGNEDANHFCLDDETEIFTRRGWQSLDTIQTTDEVITLDHETGLSSWAVISGVHSWDVVDEPMRSLESRTHSSLTTLKHRWPIVTQRGVRRWVLTEELNQRHAITTGAPCVDVPTIAKHSDALVELAAWFWTEGSIGSSVTIAQSHTVNPKRVDRIRAALLAEFGAEGFTESIQQNRSSFGGPVTVFRLRRLAGDVLTGIAPDKIVASEFVDSLTLAQLHLFIDVSCQGDGCSYRQGEVQIWQRDPSMLDAFERACILAGHAVVRRPAHEGGTVVRAQRSTRVLPVKAADEMRRTRRIGATDEIVAYTGRIWCPTVPGTENFLARRRGLTFFTGNTAWVQSDEEVRIAIQPDLDTMCWALTRLVLHDELKKAERKEWPDERIIQHRIAWDLSESAARTNKQEDSRQAHDRGLASGASVLRAAGLSVTDDRIPEWELIRLIGQKTQNAYLALVEEGTKISDIDWSAEGPAALFGKVKPGPNPASGSDEEPSAGPGVGEPGKPSEGERARTKRQTRTPSG